MHTVILLVSFVFPQIFKMLCYSLHLTFNLVINSGFCFGLNFFRVVLIINMVFLLQKDGKRMVFLLFKPLKRDYRSVPSSSASVFPPNYFSVSLHYLKGEVQGEDNIIKYPFLNQWKSVLQVSQLLKCIWVIGRVYSNFN